MATCAQAIKAWEAKHDTNKAEESIEIKLCANTPFISKMDNSLGNLKNCERLSLSTNCIDRINGLNGLPKLKVLSLGRNNIKKLEKLEEVADTLEQLWVSYNEIAALDGVGCLEHLTTFYCSRNNLKTFGELDKISHLKNLKDVLFVGNPMYENKSTKEIRVEILKHLPQVTKIDGQMVKPDEREEAKAGVNNDQ